MSFSRRFRSQTLVVALIQTMEWFFKAIFNRRIGSPPVWLKRHLLIKLIAGFRADLFVETGTYLGQTTKLVAKRFPELMVDTIEIDSKLFINAQSYLSRYFPRIKVWHGNSRSILREVLDSRNAWKILFWLDGHDSKGLTSSGEKETPLLDELQVLKSYFENTNKSFIIVIDDLHEIKSNPNYPSFKQIEKFATQNSCSFQTRWNTVIIRN